MLTDSTGLILARHDLYDAFGLPAEQAGAGGVANDRQFAGQQRDAESDHYYLRARYYDPAAGRFLSPDPLGLAGGGNLYAYAANDPVNRADPTGLYAQAAVVVAAMVILTGLAVGTYACSLNANCQRSMDRFWGGVLGFPGAVLDGWNSAGPAAYTGDPFTSSGGMAAYSGDSFSSFSAAEFDVAPHGRQPSPRAPLASHHIIQNAWAKANLGASYDESAAPSILLGPARHPAITTAQNKRRDARLAAGQGRWATSLREEFENASSDLRVVGVPDSARKRALKQAYKYFYR